MFSWEAGWGCDVMPGLGALRKDWVRVSGLPSTGIRLSGWVGQRSSPVLCWQQLSSGLHNQIAFLGYGKEVTSLARRTITGKSTVCYPDCSVGQQGKHESYAKLAPFGGKCTGDWCTPHKRSSNRKVYTCHNVTCHNVIWSLNHISLSSSMFWSNGSRKTVAYSSGGPQICSGPKIKKGCPPEYNKCCLSN